MFALSGRDAVANAEPGHRIANSNDRAGDFMARHARQHNSGTQDTGTDGNVVRADTAERDLYDDLSRPRHRVGDRLAGDGPRLAENHCEHRSALQNHDRVDRTAGSADDR